MKTILVVALILASIIVQAQEGGIKFEQGLSWAQVKEKAIEENKYIFLDGYTTWCLPCRVMTNEVFPQPKVAEFFNTNFINVAVQFDVTKKDNKEVKSWYADARKLQSTYKVNSFPTYLFFSPGGELVHTIVGVELDGDKFIERAKAALDPQKQYDNLKKAYDAGERSPEFLYSLLKAAQLANARKFLPVVANEYLSTQKDLLTEENLSLIATATSKSTERGYTVLKNNSEKVDAVAGAGKSAELLMQIAFDEIVLPRLRDGGTRTDYGGGMVMYSGTLNETVNWGEIEEELDTNYPQFSEEILLEAKLTYFEWSKNWVKFAEAVNEYLSKVTVSHDKINGYASTIFSSTDDPRCVDAALRWSKETLLGEEENLGYLYTYGSLLYKAGKKDEGIAAITRVAEKLKTEDPRVTATLHKMKQGEKTW